MIKRGPQTNRSAGIRRAVTLLELVVSMSAATVLMIGMSMSLVVVLKSAETIDSLDRSDDAILRDWVEDDLRYAHQIQSPANNQWVINRVNTNGNSETIAYQVVNQTWQRRVDGGPWSDIADSVDQLSIDRTPYSNEFESHFLLEANASNAAQPDGDFAPTLSTPEIVAVRTTANTNDTDELEIEVPPSATIGDWLIVAGSSRGGQGMTLSGGWANRINDQQWLFSGALRLQVWSRLYQPSVGSSITIECSSDTLINATILVVRGCDPYDPFAATMSRSRYHLSAATRAEPGFRDSTEPNELNLQFLALTAPTNTEPSMGLPGYPDVTSVVNSGDNDWSLFVASRQGSLPPTNTFVHAEIPIWNAYVIGSMRLKP